MLMLPVEFTLNEKIISSTSVEDDFLLLEYIPQGIRSIHFFEAEQILEDYV